MKVQATFHQGNLRYSQEYLAPSTIDGATAIVMDDANPRASRAQIDNAAWNLVATGEAVFGWRVLKVIEP